MKNALKLLIIFVSLTVTSQTFGQTIGVRAGLNSSTMAFSGEALDPIGDEVSSLTGFHVGISSEFSINKNFSFETGLLFTTKGFNINFEESGLRLDTRTNPSYIEVPLTMKTYIDIGNAKFFAILGPYVGVGIAGKTKIETNIFGPLNTMEEDINWGSDEDDDFKRLDFGLIGGIGILYKSIQVGVTYGLGLANISTFTDDDDSIKNRVIGISVGYNFTRK